MLDIFFAIIELINCLALPVQIVMILLKVCMVAPFAAIEWVSPLFWIPSICFGIASLIDIIYIIIDSYLC